MNRRYQTATEVKRQQATQITLNWAWWMNPVNAFLLLSGGTALIAASLGPESYVLWETDKFLTAENTALLFLGMAVFVVCIITTSRSWDLPKQTILTISPDQMIFLTRAYRILFTITFISYLAWFGIAFLQGVSLTDLALVLQREPGAISRLKSNAAPVAGVTTFTQLGPVVVFIGALLRRLHTGGNAYLVFVLLAMIRTVFYAERLALIEIIVPLILIYTLTTTRTKKAKLFINLVPIISPIFIWLIFAASEYNRSWIYYSNLSDMPYSRWVTLRLLGYYVTGYNNSALFNNAVAGESIVPYYSAQAFWNAPGVEQLIQHPGIGGVPISSWWFSNLSFYGEADFTNYGSFLMTNAELSTTGMVIFWLVIGSLIGLVYRSARLGSLPAVATYAALFLGLLELPRLIYWTEGRAFPIIIFACVFGLFYPRPKGRQRQPTPKIGHRRFSS